MKGTLFSADFAIDNSNNPKLLEINTDTAIGDNNIDSRIDFNDFEQVLSGSNITNLTILHKNFQDEFVKKLETFISSSASYITNITKVQVDDCSIYPEAITDASDKFILRLAYDESAVFDSLYAKNELHVFDLFHGNNDIASCVPLYHSSSTFGVIDSLSASFNSTNVPDFVSKKTFSMNVNKGNLTFYKAGLPSTGSDYRVNTLKSDLMEDNLVITNYVDSISGSYARSLRSYNIVYGTDLDLCHLGEYEIDAVLEAPTSLTTSSFSGSAVTYEISNQHRFEFVTNFPKVSKGLAADTLILSASGEGVEAQNIISGANYLYTSYFISGSPDTDDFEVLDLWKIPGSSLPSGSHVTSSVLDSVNVRTNKDWTLRKLTFAGGDSAILGSNVHMASYDATEDTIRFRKTYELDEGDLVYDKDGNSVAIVSHSILIYDNLAESNGYDLDFSSVDTYTLSGSGVVLHNLYGAARWEIYGGPTCFLAGTKIDTPNGDVNIEDLKAGDVIFSYDTKKERKVTKVVSAVDHRHTVGSHKDSCLHLGYTDAGVFDIIINGKSLNLHFTPEHPFLTKEGWKSLHPLTNQEPWLSEQEEVKYLGVGDEILVDGQWSKIEDIKFNITNESTPVYNLTVEGTHTYIANKTVVHNK